jgi:hypothetical protein
LGFKYESKSCSYLPSDDRPFVIEKLEVSIPDLGEEFLDAYPFDEKKIGKEECQEKFRKNNTSIRHIGKRLLSYRLEII